MKLILINVVILHFILLLVYVKGATRNSVCITPNNEKATCIPVSSCHVIKSAILTRNSSALDFAKQSQCGYDTKPLVCCGSAGYSVPTIIFDSSQSSSNKIVPMKHRLLPDRNACGIQDHDDRIYGGQNTTLDEFPWMALIGYKEVDGSDAGFQCGGSLISQRYVLTAAHCIKVTGLTPSKVRLGEWRISTTRDCLGGRQQVCSDPIVDVPIQKSISHPEYRKKTHDSDIALIRMARRVANTDFIRPICIPTVNSPPPATGAKLTTAGWGATELDYRSDVKLKVQVPVVDQRSCFSRLARYGPITEKQICAGGDNGKDSCRGDSGGPLMRVIDDTGFAQFQWFVEGVVSWGVECGAQGFPGVYTRVSRYANWIVSNMAD
ncbi:hypothetical protein ILUMI_14316 [Ignelater luminosus]|uniref:CLIP domain-containing serine protease n=1 Tax=Ignelater luminosus TaxID=2038154 RepID=A0A8K0CYZ2_IGNLU|nr:hypothetical protein ILUMI_14316 [Ignelater luminosus]